MKPQKFNEQFATVFEMAVRLCKAVDADALVVMLEGPTDWERLRSGAGREKVVVAADSAEPLEGAAEAGLATVVIDLPDAPVAERLTQALLESVAAEILEPGADVVVLYTAFEAGTIDSISMLSP